MERVAGVAEADDEAGVVGLASLGDLEGLDGVGVGVGVRMAVVGTVVVVAVVTGVF